MTTYKITQSGFDYVCGVIHTLQYIYSCDAKTLWDFFKDNNDPEAYFLCAVEEAINIKEQYKFVDGEPIEVENEDEPDYVEIVD